MVTKTEVKNYYANKHDNREIDEKICPEIVIRLLSRLDEDEIGLYTLAGELFGKRAYYSFDEVRESIKLGIEQEIKDLQKILNY